ncbi:hypothetical protein E4U26_005355 [Claviceps purpurea]|nr:hypothetical protein E4U37_007002 [Claviceps purpurea]KAG6232329.1 hypothetical protein E4U26_005355 [Claviceps purpurea]
MASEAKPILICGAGVVGLTLAHGLKKANIPFQIYERDEHIDARGHGWAITIHWALPFLVDLLDGDTVARLEDVQVDPEVGRNDNGNFLFLNLETLETKFRIPPNKRRRLNREKLRKVLLQGVADRVQWGKRLRDVQVLSDREGVVEADGRLVRVNFSDGSSADGSLLVGADGSNSDTRKFLVPEAHDNHALPVRLVGVAVEMTPEQVKPLRDIDPLLFQGCHPVTGHFLWVSMMETPEVNGTKGTAEERYQVQIIVSWMFKGPQDEVPAVPAARIAEMKRRARDFHPLLRRTVDSIPETAPILEIGIQDWPCLDWDNRQGRVTLVGDAAHAMTMFRGEAANHGILDAYKLVQQLKKIHARELSLPSGIDAYETEMRDRTGGDEGAVMLSRQACLDAHDFDGLNEHSAVLRRRAITTD